ncbi:MAG: FHA domain-containing protein [Methylobacter sp.]
MKHIYTQVLTIGRNADIKLLDSKETVSRVHCELIIADGGYYLRDANSRNGTYIDENGRLRKIKEAWVGLDQTIVLGECPVTLAELLGEGLKPEPAPTPRQHPVAAPEEKGPKEDMIDPTPGKRIRCPLGHVVLACLAQCPKCGQPIV